MLFFQLRSTNPRVAAAALSYLNFKAKGSMILLRERPQKSQLATLYFEGKKCEKWPKKPNLLGGHLNLLSSIFQREIRRCWYDIITQCNLS